MQEPTTAAQTSSKGVQTVPVAAETSQFVYIQVCMASLQTPPAGQQLPVSGHLYLIEGKFEDITQYAGTTVDWIIRIAHLLCDPLGTGHIFTHTTGTPSDWHSSDRTPSWQEVIHGDPLLPGIYEFDSTHPIILSKISDQQSHSVTTHGSESSSSTFHRLLLQRDSGCAVTTNEYSVIASHLIPRCIGSDSAKAIVEQFVGVTEAADIHQYHPKIGILLFSGLSYSVDIFQAGFYHIAVSHQM